LLNYDRLKTSTEFMCLGISHGGLLLTQLWNYWLYQRREFLYFTFKFVICKSLLKQMIRKRVSFPLYVAVYMFPHSLFQFRTCQKQRRKSIHTFWTWVEGIRAE